MTPLDRFAWQYHRPSFDAEKEQQRLEAESDRKRDEDLALALEQQTKETQENATKPPKP